MHDLKDAVCHTTEVYMSVSEGVLNECCAVEAELLRKPPGVLKLLSPVFAETFLKLFAEYAYFVIREVGKPLLDAGGRLSVCIAALQCALSRLIDRVDIVYTSHPSGRSTMPKNLESLPHLLALSIRRSEGLYYSALLATVADRVKCLQVFVYPHYCTNNMIFVLRLHCPHLTEVDVSYSYNITNDSVRHLIQITDLKWLNVQETRIDAEKYGFIISKLPDIANISFNRNKIFVLFHTRIETLDTITHIKSSYDDLDGLSDKCPNTTSITLFEADGDLSRLTAFNALRALEIIDLFYPMSNLNTVLRETGHRLQELTLSHCSRVNLQDIVTLCPCLVNLSFRWCSFLHSHTPFDPQLPHFKNLINLQVQCAGLASIYIPYYISLERIHWFMDRIFTVEFVKEVTSLGAFTRLEVFHIEECWPGALTMEALQLLIRHCPRLKRIEGLVNCPRLDKRDITELKRQISEQNYDLVIDY
jgi:hypothetical protein